MCCSESENITVPAIDMSELGFADTDGVLQHRLKDRLKLTGRRTDDLKDLRGRGLLLQGFAEIVRALAQLVEQSRVLDGDDSLRGEIADQLDLLLSKRAYLLAVDADGANQFLFLEHWNHKESSDPTKLDHSDDSRIALLPISRFHGEVGNVNKTLCGCHPLKWR